MKEETWDLRKAVMDFAQKAYESSEWREVLNLGDHLHHEITSKMPCPHVVNNRGVTSYCDLAESSVVKLMNDLKWANARIQELQNEVEKLCSPKEMKPK